MAKKVTTEVQTGYVDIELSRPIELRLNLQVQHPIPI